MKTQRTKTTSKYPRRPWLSANTEYLSIKRRYKEPRGSWAMGSEGTSSAGELSVSCGDVGWGWGRHSRSCESQLRGRGGAKESS